MKVTICRGLPSAGKTTWAKEQVLKSGGRIKRINKDDLRSMLDNDVYTPKNEQLIKSLVQKLTKIFVSAGYDVILDDTNLAEKTYVDLIGFLRVNEIHYTVKLFDTSVEECIKRNTARENPIPNDAIHRMNKIMLKILIPEQCFSS